MTHTPDGRPVVNGLSVPRSKVVRWITIHLGVASILFTLFAFWQTEIIGQDLRVQLREHDKAIAVLDKAETKIQGEVAAMDARLRAIEAMNIGPTLATLQANAESTAWLLRGVGGMLIVLIFEMLFRVARSFGGKGGKESQLPL